MTKFSKVLTVLATVLSVAFMGFAFISFATQTDFKTRDANLKTEIQPLADVNKRLTDEITVFENRLNDAKLSIASDVPGIGVRAKNYQSALDALAKKSAELSTEIAETSRKATIVSDEAKLRREEGIQLSNQLAELRAQRAATEAEKQKLTDLLVQARGVLERVERRNKNLKTDLPAGSDYDQTPAGEGDQKKSDE